MKRLPKELMFIQEYGTYTNQMLVIVGVSDKKKVFRFLKKNRVNVDFSKWVLEDFSDWKENIDKKLEGMFCWKNGVGGVVLILRPPNDSWEYWEVLMHEIHHAVQHLAKQKDMFEELEAQAYLFEHLFRSIRKKLQGIDKI